MIAVGITGSYASGKTFVLEYLSNMGFSTFSADEYVRNLYKNPKVQKQILKLLPNLKIFDRVRIAKLIYSDDLARKKLQDFIHPFVIEGLETFKQQNELSKFTFAEIPLLFEAGFNEYFDFVVTTFCSEESRIKRAATREFFDLVTYGKIGKIQLPQQNKMNRADFIINTDCNLIELDDQIIQLIKKLKCIN